MRIETDTGAIIPLGTTEATPTIGIIDYSRRVTDDYGVTTVVERGFARRMSVRLMVPTDQADALQQRLADLRATPVRWIADDRFAWLSPYGFYKDFSLDLAVPPTSFCTLSVEGLTVSETVPGGAGDPAPDGQESTLQLLQPDLVGPPGSAAVLAQSDVLEEFAEWSALATYAAGNRVVKAATRRTYESVSAANLGNDPAGDSGRWIDVGPMNRWAMFDQALGSATTGASAVTVGIDGTAIDAIALLDVTGATVRVQAVGYDRTQAVSAGALPFLDLPATTGRVTVTIAGPDLVSIGTLLIGRLVPLGITEASPTAEITDYSRKEIDDFGDVTVVQRAWAKRMTARALIRTEAIDGVANRIAAVRAQPSLWVGQAGLDSLTVYGFFKEFAIEVGEAVSKLSLSIEGLSKAAPLPVPPNAAGALTGYLTNESHTLPADSAGNVTSYSGASGSFVVYHGADDVTADCVFAAGTGIGSGESGGFTGFELSAGGAYAVTGVVAGQDAFWINLTATHSATGLSVTRRFSLAKAKAGSGATPPALIQIEASDEAIKFDEADHIVTGNVFVTLFPQNSAATPLLRLVRPDGVAQISARPIAQLIADFPESFQSHGANGVMMTQAYVNALMQDLGRIRIEALLGDAFDTLSLFKVKDGSPGREGRAGYAPMLSNESHTLPADNAGTVTSYAGAQGRYQVFAGGTEVTSSFAFAVPIGGNPHGLTGAGGAALIDAGSGQFAVGGGFDANEANASLTLRATGSGAHAGVVLDRIFSLAKVKAGADGTPPALIQMDVSDAAIQYDAAGNIVTGNVFVTIATQNSAAAPLIRLVRPDGAEQIGWRTIAQLIADFPTAFQSHGANGVMMTQAYVNALMQDLGSIRLEASLPGDVIDWVTLFRVKDGENGTPGQDALVLAPSQSPAVIRFTYAGAPKSGELPRYVQMTLRKGAANVTTGAGWAIVGASAGVAATIGPSSGLLIISGAVPGAGYIDLKAHYGGVDYPLRLPLTFQQDAPPPSTARQLSIGVNAGAPASATYGAGPVSGIVTVTSSAAGQLPAVMSLSYDADATGVAPNNKTYTAVAKFRYRVPGGSWIDFADGETTGTQATLLEGGGDASSGTLNASQSQTGLGANLQYEVSIWVRRGAGNTSATLTGTLVAGAAS